MVCVASGLRIAIVNRGDADRLHTSVCEMGKSSRISVEELACVRLRMSAMTIDHARDKADSHPTAARAAVHASPGKRTQVEAIAPEAHAASAAGVDLKQLQDFIAKHEGYRDHVYRDSRGFPTAGIGHLLTGGNWQIGQKVSAAQITAWFKADVASAITGAKQSLGGTYDKLDDARKMVVIDMVFNLGSAGFGSFHQTIAAIKSAHYAQAATNMLQSLWAKQVGHRATEDAAIMRSGHLAGGGGTEVHDPDKSDKKPSQTGGVAAPDDKHDDKHGDTGTKGAAKGTWAKAPSLDAVKSGSATLHTGEQGAAVKHVQHLLAIDEDGKFGPGTRAAVADFQRLHHQERHDGVVDDHTLAALTKHPVGSVKGESRDGAAQRHKMLGIAHGASAGNRPDGRCYYHVCQFLVACGGYGKIKNPYTQFPGSYLPYAHDFADLMNAQGPAHWGLERLSMHSPYDAPAGAIVVVAAGSPGTSHPTAGDIAVASGTGEFYNGGMMSYSGRAGWNASPKAKLLGVYIPK